MEPKFKIGDHIVPIDIHKGMEQAMVTNVDDKNYYLKIMCGTAIIPIGAQINYKLKNQ